MFLLGKSIYDTTEEDIMRLIDNGVEESKILEYKAELKIDTDGEKKNFLADVTAMANTDGGIIVFGLKERKDENGQNTGTVNEVIGIAENKDKLIQKIEDVVFGGTNPKVNPVPRFITIEGKEVLLIGVRKFATLPHMITFQSSNRFYKRKNSGNYLVDTNELNDMFMNNFLLRDRIKNFVNERIFEISKGSILPVVEGQGSLYIHIIPISYIDENPIDLTSSNNFEFLQSNITSLFDRASWDAGVNLEGFYIYHIVKGGNIPFYCQVFRNGILECYTTMLCTPDQSGSKVFIDAIELDSYKTIKKTIEIYKQFSIEPPYVVFMNLRNTKECYLRSNRNKWGPIKTLDREHIQLPSAIISTIEPDIWEVMKPVFNTLWQAGGYLQSLNYEKDGSVIHFMQ